MPTLTEAAAPTHTAGPWRIKDGLIVADAKDEAAYYEEHIGVVYRTEAWTSGEPVESEDQANARLIASAPDLLAALRDAVAYMSGYGMSDAEQSILDAARAAIAKALGA